MQPPIKKIVILFKIWHEKLMSITLQFNTYNFAAWRKYVIKLT
jgi:hypothetical protein